MWYWSHRESSQQVQFGSLRNSFHTGLIILTNTSLSVSHPPTMFCECYAHTYEEKNHGKQFRKDRVKNPEGKATPVLSRCLHLDQQNPWPWLSLSKNMAWFKQQHWTAVHKQATCGNLHICPRHLRAKVEAISPGLEHIWCQEFITTNKDPSKLWGGWLGCGQLVGQVAGPCQSCRSRLHVEK